MALHVLPETSAYGQNVKPYDGAKQYFYEAGTTTLKTIYTLPNLTVAHANPVIADEYGRFDPIFLSGQYKCILKDKNDVEIWSVDNLTGKGGDVSLEGDFDSSTNGGDYPSSGSQGDLYKVSTGFTLNSASGGHILKTGDFIICNTDGATAIDDDWDIIRGVVQNTGTFALTDAATIATDCSKSTAFTVTLGATRILGNPTNKNIGQTYTWIITGAGYDLTYGSDFDFAGDSAIFANGVTVIEGVAVASDSIRCRILNGPVKKVDWSAKNLIVDVATVTTVTVTADKLELINSDGNTIIFDDVSDTFDITTDIHAGTEKASHWYQLWVSANSADGALILKMAADYTGTADGTTANYLDDSTHTLATDGYKIGDILYNTTDNTQTTLAETPSADGADVLLTDDIMADTEDYTVRSLSPTDAGEFKADVSAVYNDSGSDLDTTFFQKGDRVSFDEIEVLTSGTATTPTAVPLETAIPVNCKLVMMRTRVIASSGASAGIILTPSASGGGMARSVINTSIATNDPDLSTMSSLLLKEPQAIYYDKTAGSAVVIEVVSFEY